MKPTNFPHIEVSVIPEFLPQQSRDDVFVFSYTVRIRNRGEAAAQLIARTWSINDGEGRHEKVRGLGVVGEQPLLQPGEICEYSSGCHLQTPTGTMHGSYFFVTEEGDGFSVDIPLFVLDALSRHQPRKTAS